VFSVVFDQTRNRRRGIFKRDGAYFSAGKAAEEPLFVANGLDATREPGAV
jgi:hypothetical protein